MRAVLATEVIGESPGPGPRPCQCSGRRRDRDGCANAVDSDTGLVA